MLEDDNIRLESIIEIIALKIIEDEEMIDEAELKKRLKKIVVDEIIEEN